MADETTGQAAVDREIRNACEPYFRRLSLFLASDDERPVPDSELLERVCKRLNVPHYD